MRNKHYSLSSSQNASSRVLSGPRTLHQHHCCREIYTLKNKVCHLWWLLCCNIREKGHGKNMDGCFGCGNCFHIFLYPFSMFSQHRFLMKDLQEPLHASDGLHVIQWPCIFRTFISGRQPFSGLRIQSFYYLLTTEQTELLKTIQGLTLLFCFTLIYMTQAVNGQKFKTIQKQIHGI